MYFSRHPAELVIGSEPVFIHEMNTYVLGVLQSDVEAVGDGLSAIGQTYLHNQGSQTSLALALNSRMKTLTRIRKSGGLKIEQVTSMILALVSMELIDTDYRPSESSLQALHSAAAAMINHFLATGLTLSPTAKYMIRALAREDIIMALVRQKRPLIQTSVWLDKECGTSADRFMGSTMTLMPLIEEVCVLAEDLQQFHCTRRTSMDAQYLSMYDLVEDNVASPSLLQSRAASLRARISAWHPPLIPAFSGPASRKFLLHASMYRLGALLYLHRLLHPHGSSKHQDDQALIIAYDIFAHLSTEARDNRLALFPIFLATCEFEKEEDRSMGVQVFDEIYGSRNTFSTLVTKNFVLNRVWGARDEGRDWGWMGLVERWKGECVPI
ncbi:hypothetical protein K505DRAFT_376166 [Melanomma pulvis-pyrius CBS 109.77]|uniref:Fungal-specific transcription factor domain-containing protein n=1 Tax=Melanomma pulvis-pyrius CBS 109.77 TaxID=1314802 RepID=A0A6A6X7C4_9PLEO|nr:hypothetical protein K505DRAFT_376166 [Melanomma pulvis-pyrius CBS 109.77]